MFLLQILFSGILVLFVFKIWNEMYAEWACAIEALPIVSNSNFSGLYCCLSWTTVDHIFALKDKKLRRINIHLGLKKNK